MTTPTKIFDAIQDTRDQATFIQRLLIDALGWHVEDRAEQLEDIAYEYTAEELTARALQIRPFTTSQPWGIFVIELDNELPFATGRGFTGVLRQIMNRLRSKKPDLPSFKPDNLLFIVTHQYRHFRFAYFKPAPNGGKTRPLAHFGWCEGDTHIRTLCEHNLIALAYPRDDTDPAAWQQEWAKAFDVEKVTKEFYRQYDIVFRGVEAEVHGVPPGEPRRLYTQRLLNRLMFLYFLQKKGWLEYNGSRKYLRELYKAAEANNEDFLNDRLYTLFFNGLNVRREDLAPENLALIEERCGIVPYLNGGLFSLADEYDRLNAVQIPNAAFGQILGLFEHYNFTITESTPLDIEVAVDPEMLGKVFEELVTGRHETGSYYTPRPVVSFMCREALKGYLAAKTKLDSETVAALVDRHDLSSLSIDDAHIIHEALDTLKAVDPACGSGAYLLGLMHEMVDIYNLLYSDKLKRNYRTLHKLKMQIITKNLYGVDKDEFAIGIARLRLWLSLAVDCDKALPLPNLDFKIEEGDSILAADPSSSVRGTLYQHDNIRKFDELKAVFTGGAFPDGKDELLNEIKSLRKKIADAMHIPAPNLRFDWRLDFAEVWQENGGFDIVLANPPYVRQELIKDIKPLLQGIHPKVYSGTADLYCYFYARAVELLKPGGMLAFISSNKWFRASYGAKLRQYIARSCRVVSITDFGELAVFNAATFPMIFIVQKQAYNEEGHDSSGALFTQVKSLEPPYPDVLALVAKNGVELGKDSITTERYAFTNREINETLKTMERNGIPLRDYVDGRIYYGIKTGCNEAFIIDAETKNQLVAQDARSAEIIKPLAVGDDVRKWHIRQRDRWLIFTPIGVEIRRYPAVFEHLKQWQDRLESRCDKGNYWWELRACDYYDVFAHPKIVFPEIAREPRFTLDSQKVFPIKTIFSIACNDTYLLGVLNSSSTWAYLKSICSVLGDAERGGRLLLQKIYIERIPIPGASESERTAIGILVQQCLDARGENCEEWEREIDERVARLYGI